MKTFGIICKHAPSEKLLIQETLDIAFTARAFNHPVSVFFLEDSVYCLYPNVVISHFSNHLLDPLLLDMFKNYQDIKAYVNQQDLEKRKLQSKNTLFNIIILADSNHVQQIIETQDIII